MFSQTTPPPKRRRSKRRQARPKRRHAAQPQFPIRARAAVEIAIEALLAALDAIDGNPDAEDDGSAEPSLGWRNENEFSTGYRQGFLQQTGEDDRESDSEDYEETHDDEPSLGWSTTGALWLDNPSEDLEIAEQQP